MAIRKNIYTNRKTIKNTVENCTVLQNDFAHFYSIESSALFSSDKVNEQTEDKNLTIYELHRLWLEFPNYNSVKQEQHQIKYFNVLTKSV
jgi:hypothetical protein